MTREPENGRCLLLEVETYDNPLTTSRASTFLTEQEDVWDWITTVGGDVVKGIATGAAAGPVGAVLGGLAGAGVGAIQASQQPKTDKPPTSQEPKTVVVSSPSAPPGKSDAAPPTTGQTTPANASNSASLIQQLLQLLPPLLSQLQAKASQPSSGTPKPEAKEDVDSGDYVPNSVWTRGYVTAQSVPGDSPDAPEGVRGQESLLDWLAESAGDVGPENSTSEAWVPMTAEWLR